MRQLKFIYKIWGYWYAETIKWGDRMAVKAYNDELRVLLANVKCVLAFDTAADFLGLTNGG